MAHPRTVGHRRHPRDAPGFGRRMLGRTALRRSHSTGRFSVSRTLTLRKNKSRPVADATKDWAAPKVETAKDWAAPKVETAKDWAAPKVESGVDKVKTDVLPVVAGAVTAALAAS